MRMSRKLWLLLSVSLIFISVKLLFSCTFGNPSEEGETTISGTMSMNSGGAPLARASALTPLAGHKLHCWTVTGTHVEETGVSDSNGHVSLTLKVKNPTFSCNIMNPSNQVIADLNFADTSGNSGASVHTTGDIPLGPITVFPTGTATAIIPPNASIPGGGGPTCQNITDPWTNGQGTASGTYSYDPVTHILTLNTTTYNFQCYGPPPGSWQIPILLTATTLRMGSMVFTRTSSDPNSVVGSWTATEPNDTGGNATIYMTMGADGKMSFLSCNASCVNLHTTHYFSSSDYGLDTYVGDDFHRATSVTISGPGLTGTVNLVWDDGEWFLDDGYLGVTPPSVGSQYAITIYDAQGTHNATAGIRGYVNTAPVCINPPDSSSATSPVLFQWGAVSDPDFLDYDLWIDYESGTDFDRFDNLINNSQSVVMPMDHYYWGLSVEYTYGSGEIECGYFQVH